MTGADVHAVLKKAGATHLHHANSVLTSATFLRQGGLVSRHFAEQNRLPQTPQPMSDQIDKRYRIWDGIFLDHVNIHRRAKRRNKYGPVLFEFGLDSLLKLPTGSTVGVTKLNPIYWRDAQQPSDRWFQSAAELASRLQLGDFDKMLVIRTPTEKLDFPLGSVALKLDDPQRNLKNGKDAYTSAIATLQATGRSITITPHNCLPSCRCVSDYQQEDVDFFFS
ncbi:MAG TPA: hypothetical protein DCQ33_14530 [Nitrospira sp.]|nr:hypothetical protein [Nitrospira sp.]